MALSFGFYKQEKVVCYYTEKKKLTIAELKSSRLSYNVVVGLPIILWCPLFRIHWDIIVKILIVD
jgi:hypothetical protein